MKKSYAVRFIEGIFVGLGIGMGVVIMSLTSAGMQHATNLFLNFIGY